MHKSQAEEGFEVYNLETLKTCPAHVGLTRGEAESVCRSLNRFVRQVSFRKELK